MVLNNLVGIASHCSQLFARDTSEHGCCRAHLPQVGVLFRDGPIGVKLGANPLKASGVCRVYVTEVNESSDWRDYLVLTGKI